jgi:hypothetical protein
MDGHYIADRQFTIETYLERSARTALPLGLGFIQSRIGNGRRSAGPLAEFVRRGRESAFEQYLLLHAIASGEREGFNVRLAAAVWGRAIGGFFDADTGEVDEAALHQVSRNWKFLRDVGLVRTERAGRQVRATILSDDGGEGEYGHPGKGRRDQKLDGPGYLQLPYEYWRERWHEKLKLPAKAMLLIALYPGDGFPLPIGKVPKWYGISESTGERGLTELVEKGLLHVENHRRPDAGSPVGFTDANYYELLPPFGPRGKRSALAHQDWVGVTEKAKPRRSSKRRARPKSKSTSRRKERSR